MENANINIFFSLLYKPVFKSTKFWLYIHLRVSNGKIFTLRNIPLLRNSPKSNICTISKNNCGKKTTKLLGIKNSAYFGEKNVLSSHQEQQELHIYITPRATVFVSITFSTSFFWFKCKIFRYVLQLESIQSFSRVLI